MGHLPRAYPSNTFLPLKWALHELLSAACLRTLSVARFRPLDPGLSIWVEERGLCCVTVHILSGIRSVPPRWCFEIVQITIFHTENMGGNEAFKKQAQRDWACVWTSGHVERCSIKK
ncbi:hypothetical protein PROFUN_07681 [Planoprotostelium fungivorum]|uniref:Uncharacterized protein n=1 Tax=Planoprotostelium fungivorum TaxID=1890364 RepID=A0A2P6MM57_9EUKA|nr:hypothetical protein PROFUN_07681 [Planoprotostelium fungivorum]